MKKKFLTMAEKVQEDIERIKYILQGYNERILSNKYIGEDLIEVEDRKSFMEEQLREHEALYIKYKETNELYYEPNTYEYFKNSFSKISDFYGLNNHFVYQIEFFIDDNITFSQKGNILDNLFKAYKEREGEILNEN